MDERQQRRRGQQAARRRHQGQRRQRVADERASWTRRRGDGTYFTHRPGRRERTVLVAKQVVNALFCSVPYFLVLNHAAFGSGPQDTDMGATTMQLFWYTVVWAYIVYRAATVSLTITDTHVVVRNVFLTRRYPLEAITVGEIYQPGDLKLHVSGLWGGASWWTGISATTARSPENPRPLKITALGSRTQGAPVVERFEAALDAALRAQQH